MKRFMSYLGTAAALVIVFLIATGPSSTTTVVGHPAPAASSTITIVPTAPAPTTLEPAPPTPVAETLPAPKKAAPKTSAATSTPIPVTAPVPVQVLPPPSTPTSTNAALDAAASALRAALVNIICYVPTGSGLHSISGSGIFIDAKGIILTNAHIAQYFLLADRNVSCTVRTGSPAVDRYLVAPVYISPAWLRANSTVLTQASPSGTGEYDFALLAVTKTVSNTELPSVFPSIPLATMPLTSGAPVVIASYGAQFLDSSQIQSTLFPTVVFGSVKDVFTFGTNTIDVLALGGSAAAQEGSSGGGVAGASGELVGTITTSTVSGSTDTRSLDAITASYIRAEYASETGNALDLLLARPTSASVADFALQIPTLELILKLP